MICKIIIVVQVLVNVNVTVNVITNSYLYPMPSKLLLLTPYPLDRAPSQRFRFELFLEELGDYDHQSFLSEKGWKILYTKGNTLQKIWAVLSGIVRRKWLLTRINKYDIVFIHRELMPFGPPIIEWFIAKIFRKKIIYDFDDAIWLNDGHDGNPLWTWLKWRSKVASICKWSWKVSAGNDYLADFARQYCDKVVVMPTVVDTGKMVVVSKGTSRVIDRNHLKDTIREPQGDIQNLNPKPQQQPNHPITQSPNHPTIGWTGSHSTLFYLDTVIPVLRELEHSYEFHFIVISNKDPQLDLKNYQFIQWSKEKEVKDLAKIDIGIMPLEDTEWAKGKCGFKLIQYGAMGIPSVASPVGANKQVIIENKTGYFATSKEEWKAALEKLLENGALKYKMGQSARKYIEENYSVESKRKIFRDLLNTNK